MTEELKQKAKDFIDRINKESDGMWLNNYYLSDLLVMFATEATKELQEENNELKGKLMLSDMVLTDKTKRIKELEDKLMDKVCLESLDIVSAKIKDLEKENAELRKVAEFQQSSNMSRHFENKKLKEGLAVGSMWNKHLNSLNKTLEEERDKYRNMVFDKDEQLTKAKEIIKKLYAVYYAPCVTESDLKYRDELFAEIKQFLSEVKK